MKEFLSSLVLLVALCSSAPSQVDAKINGPAEARVGDLIVLSARESVGDNHKWVEPQKIQTLLCGDGKDLAFATGTPGTYQFMLIVADKAAEIDYTVHTVVVKGAAINPPPPDEEPGPTPPAPVLQELEKVSRDAAAKLNDAATAKALADGIYATAQAIEQQCAAGTCPGLPATTQRMIASIEAALLGRKGASRDVDWANGWRVPVNAKLKAYGAVDVASYLTAMRAIASGLR